MKQRTVTTLLCGVALALLLSLTAEAQTLKIGFIRDEKIMTSFKAWQTAQTEFETMRKSWDDEAASMQEELQSLVDEYDKQRLILSDDKKKEKEAAILTKQQALDGFTRQIYGPNGQAERKQAELIQPLLDRVNQAIEAIAVEGNYDVIFTAQSGLGYIKDAYDVTDKVITYLENAEN